MRILINRVHVCWLPESIPWMTEARRYVQVCGRCQGRVEWNEENQPIYRAGRIVNDPRRSNGMPCSFPGRTADYGVLLLCNLSSVVERCSALKAMIFSHNCHQPVPNIIMSVKHDAVVAGKDGGLRQNCSWRIKIHHSNCWGLTEVQAHHKNNCFNY